jgi:FkbM family methyltransferase
MNIFFKRNNDDIVTEKLKKANLPIVIYGNGSIAKYTRKKLIEKGLNCDQHVVDEEYLSYCPECLSIKECNNKFEKYILLLGFFEAFFTKKDELIKKFYNAEQVLYYSETYGYEEITYDYFIKNKDKFEKVYEKLEDPLSKLCYEAFLNSKINFDLSYILPYVVLPQYVPKYRVFNKKSEDEFLSFGDEEVFVNCGAFTGDTIKSLLFDLSIQFNKIYAVEPDPSNVAKLKRFISENNLTNLVKIVEVGLSNKKGITSFSSDGNMKSAIKEGGNEKIILDTIDNITESNKITFINMDIEGAEVPAVLGAKKTISTFKPKLAISAYHNRDDTFNLLELIETINSNYKFYFRLHKPVAIDAVLYAI